AFGVPKAAMADTAAAQRATGYVTGGISPVGQKKKLATAIDSTAQHHASIFVSAGRRGLELELAPEDLASLCDAPLLHLLLDTHPHHCPLLHLLPGLQASPEGLSAQVAPRIHPYRPRATAAFLLP